MSKSRLGSIADKFRKPEAIVISDLLIMPYIERKNLEAYAVLGKLADIEKRLEQIEERLKRIESKLGDNQHVKP